MKKIDYIQGKKNAHRQLVHASNVCTKQSKYKKLTVKRRKALDKIVVKYYDYLKKNCELIGCADDVIIRRVEWLNEYYNFIKENKYDNVFSSQGKLRSTILEEFMYILFRDYISEIRETYNDENGAVKCGSVEAYANLYISAGNLQQFIERPRIEVNVKKQDFSIYRDIKLTINDTETIANVPIIAVENKTYVDKTMLEGSVATAEKIKLGNPYAKFYIVAENYDVDLEVDPVYSRIDQIYVLRKNKSTEEFQQIDGAVVLDFFHDVQAHMQRDWANVERKMRITGKII